MQYTVRPTHVMPPFDGDWSAAAWQPAETLEVAHFHARSGSHRPRTQARLLYDSDAIYVFFQVDDQHVVSIIDELQGPVCKDSCVEFFVQPRGEGPYFNFEINAGGVLHCTYIRDHRRSDRGFRDYHIIDPAELRLVQIRSSLPALIEEPIAEPITWTMQFRIPLVFLETYTGSLRPLAGQTWRANFYKCGSEQHHWATWAPINDELNFHQPQFYAPIHFAP